MKGVGADIIYISMSFIVFVVVFALLFANIFTVTSRVDLHGQDNTYVLVNALKSARLYAQSSMDFSFYQAAYNNSLQGGYYDISGVEVMSNELLPLCQKQMEKYEGCREGEDNLWGETIYTGMEFKGTEHFNRYPVGLLQCILSRLRDKDTGEVYYNLRDERIKDNGFAIKQIDCDFGTVTDKGVKGFQEDYGLDVTGNVDSKTLDKLREVFLSKWGDCSKFFSGCQDNVKYMVFWKESGGDIVPGEEKLIEELKPIIRKMMYQYTKGGYEFLGEYVRLPIYEESGINLEETGYGFLNVTLESQDGISLTRERTDLKERVNLRLSSTVNNVYPLRYPSGIRDMGAEMYWDAKDFDCGYFIPGDKPKHRESISGFVVDAEVWEKEDSPCELVVKVTVTDTTRLLPVHNGKEVSFEPVTLEFLVHVGPGGSIRGEVKPSPVFEGKIVVLDPGHGGKYVGAVSADGNVKEKDVNLEIAKKLRDYLLDKGANIVVLTRDGDTIVNTADEDIDGDGDVDLQDDLKARAKIANDNNADMFISIHANSNPGCTARGTETYVWCVCPDQTEGQVDICQLDECEDKNEFFEDSRKLAEKIHPALIKAIGTEDRSVRGADMTVLQGAEMPAILIEAAYVCNNEEAGMLSDPDKQYLIAEAISGGMEEYYG